MSGRKPCSRAQIEGTQSTLSDLLTYESMEAPGTPVGDTREVSRYVAALLGAAESINTGRLPLSLRLLRETHAELMRDGHGARHDPGEFRRTQNWVGGTRPGNAIYVPPPPHEMHLALDNFEKYLHRHTGPQPAPILKAGIAHAQFRKRSISFLDGNGRVGRLLISLITLWRNAYFRGARFSISALYLKENPDTDYYDAGFSVCVATHGDWERWIRFYLVGVEAVARQATDTTQALGRLFKDDEARVRAPPAALRRGRPRSPMTRLRRHIIVSATRLAQDLDLSWPTVPGIDRSPLFRSGSRKRSPAVRGISGCMPTTANYIVTRARREYLTAPALFSVQSRRASRGPDRSDRSSLRGSSRPRASYQRCRRAGASRYAGACAAITWVARMRPSMRSRIV